MSTLSYMIAGLARIVMHVTSFRAVAHWHHLRDRATTSAWLNTVFDVFCWAARINSGASASVSDGHSTVVMIGTLWTS